VILPERFDVAGDFASAAREEAVANNVGIASVVAEDRSGSKTFPSTSMGSLIALRRISTFTKGNFAGAVVIRAARTALALLIGLGASKLVQCNSTYTVVNKWCR